MIIRKLIVQILFALFKQNEIGFAVYSSNRIFTNKTHFPFSYVTDTD